MGRKENRIDPMHIKQYWEEYLIRVGKFDGIKEYWEADYCFACGMKEVLQRAHIIPMCIGGKNEVGNIHLLCSWCHIDSEHIEKLADYYGWFLGRSVMDQIISEYLKRGGNISDILIGKTMRQLTLFENEEIGYYNTSITS